MVDLKVRTAIVLKSPSGRLFTCRWAGGTRSVKKRLARYSYAGVNGEVLDDYGTDGVTYPINLIFFGGQHKKEAKDFFAAFQERGKWVIKHPTEGDLGLQGVEATEQDQPVSEINITRVDTQWVEYIDPVTLTTLRNTLIELGAQTDEMEEESADSALSRMDDSAAGVKEASNAATSVMNTVIQAYNKSQYGVQEAMDAQEQLKDDIAMGFILAVGMVASVQNIIKAPGRAIADIKARIQTMKDVVNDLFDEKNDPIEPNVNDAIIKEVAATSALASIAEAVYTAVEGIESGLQSRAELLFAIEEYEVLVESVDAGVDRMATKVSTRATATTVPTIEERYIQFEDTNVNVKRTKAKTKKALKEQFFRLPTEKRVVIKKPMSIMQVAKEYYGTTGDADEKLDRIEQANAFTGNQILLLPAGTQVRLYE